MSIEIIMKSLETVEKQLDAFSQKAEAEQKAKGKVDADTKAALDQLGVQQRELADRMLKMEQADTGTKQEETKAESWGAQFVKSKAYGGFREGAKSAAIEVKNTISGSDTTVAPDRRPGVVAGATNMLTIESLYTSIQTTSNAIEYMREATFVNNAAETAQAAAKPESDVTFSLVNTPVATVAHWLRITRQLAMDNAALTAYVDGRLRYGVNRRIETQLVSGNGVAPNLSGFMTSGNFTAHGYADAALGATLKKFVLVRKIIADLWAAGYPVDGSGAIVMNPVDWAQMEIDAIVSTSNFARVSYDEAGNPRLFGVPVIQSVGMAADSFAVGNFRAHGNLYNREGVTVAMSESDATNFTTNLITLRAERRLALTSEVPAAIRGGDLTPA